MFLSIGNIAKGFRRVMDNLGIFHQQVLSVESQIKKNMRKSEKKIGQILEK